MKLIFISFILFFIMNESMAASCCGGGVTSSPLLTGDLKAVIRFGLSEKDYLADTNENNYSSRSKDEVDALRSYTLSSSYKISDFSQLGIVLPAKERLRDLGGEWESKTSPGDLQLNYGYEFFSEYTYNPYLSQAITYTAITLPTGKSIYTTDEKDEMDVTGTGHEVYEIGSLFIKNFLGKRIDFQASFKFRPAKSFKNNIRTRASLGQSFALTYTHDLSDKISMSLSQGYDYESLKLTSIKGLEKRDELLMPSSFSLLYSLSEEFDTSLTYTDDFIFGGRNTALGKTLGISFIKKFLL